MNMFSLTEKNHSHMTLGRKVGLYTKNGKKKCRFYEIDGFKMGDFQIWQFDILSISWNFSLEKAVIFCQIWWRLQQLIPFSKDHCTKKRKFFFAHLEDPPSDRASYWQKEVLSPHLSKMVPPSNKIPQERSRVNEDWKHYLSYLKS